MTPEQRIEEGKKRLKLIKETAADGMMNPEVSARRLCEVVVCVVDAIECFISEGEADKG